MNIGIVTTWFERGAAYVSRQFLDALAEEHQVFIYSRGGEREARGSGEWDKHYVTWGAPAVIDEPSAVDLRDFNRWLEEKKIEWVLFNEQRSWAPVLLCAKKKICTAAYVVHYTEQTIPFFWCYDLVICNSRHHFGIFRDHPQVHFIPWGTDLSRFRPSGKDFMEEGTTTFFHSGGMNPHRKGTDLVVEAFSRLRPGPHKAKLVLHSQMQLEQSSPRAARVVERLRETGLLAYIEGTVPDLAGLCSQSDVCVYPTRHEGLGLTIAESLACGVPILVTDQEPVSEHADHESVRAVAVAHRYARPDGDYWPQSLVDIDSLTEAMQFFVDQPECIPRLKREARRLAETRLDWRKNAAVLPGLFRQAQRLDTEGKRTALKGAEDFEAKRYTLALRNWAGYRYPSVIRAVRFLRRAGRV